MVLTPARLDFRYLNEFRFSNNYEVALSTICSFDVDVEKVNISLITNFILFKNGTC